MDLTNYNKVVELICGQLPVQPEAITRESRLVQDLGADSANIMILVMDIEQAYGIEVNDDMIASVSTVGDIVDYIEQHVQ